MRVLIYRLSALWGKQKLSRQEYVRALQSVIDGMKPVQTVLTEKGLWKAFGNEWSEHREQEGIDACSIHILDFQDAHNRLRSIKPESPLFGVQATALMASQAYFETIASYVEYRRMFLSADYRTKRYMKVQRDVRQWDRIAHEEASKLIKELCGVSPVQIPESLTEIATEFEDFGIGIGHRYVMMMD